MQPRRIRLASGEVITPEDLEETTRVRPSPPIPTSNPPVLLKEVIVPVKYPRSDRELLDAIISKEQSLFERERKAFHNMRILLVGGSVHHLEWKQRQWAQRVAARLGFDVGW